MDYNKNTLYVVVNSYFDEHAEVNITREFAIFETLEEVAMFIDKQLKDDTYYKLFIYYLGEGEVVNLEHNTIKYKKDWED